MFGLTMDKAILLLVLAGMLIGPGRLPLVAAKIGGWARAAREYAESARRRVQNEVGDDFDVDWRSLDPRQYDPRRIIREALDSDESPQPPRTPEPRHTPTRGIGRGL